ncbi:hypothetical protein FBQ95_14310 [Chloroflexi bacterium CFX3]|nr:hypothetical protein [Chloroflexi bacterium CFX3]
MSALAFVVRARLAAIEGATAKPLSGFTKAQGSPLPRLAGLLGGEFAISNGAGLTDALPSPRRSDQDDPRATQFVNLISVNTQRTESGYTATVWHEMYPTHIKNGRFNVLGTCRRRLIA